MEERRKAQRFQVVDLDIYATDEEQKIGKVVNLSETGLLLHSNSILEEGMIQKYRINFIKTVAGKVHFDFEAQVVWNKENPTGMYKYQIGLKFLDYAELQVQFIQQMIRTYSSASI